MNLQADVSTHLLEVKPSLLADRRAGELYVMEGIDEGASVSLAAGPLCIGTAAGAHLRLSDPTVSPLHCQISARGNGFRIVDLGSTNGTFVAGVRVRDVELLASGTVRVGGSVLRLELGNEPVRAPLSRRSSFGSILGASAEMRRLYAVLERDAASELPLLIQGEAGTGKELVARQVHEHSARRAGPFVALDCGAIAPDVIEGELFGHVRGSRDERAGLLEEAHGGTLFLDEIGALPRRLQSKLLQVLETHLVRRVGANVDRPADVRLLAATNHALAQSVNTGAFDEDLYCRLAASEVTLPPLRARREDIAVLAQAFCAHFSDGQCSAPPELLSALATRSWPGNVRELRNLIQRWVKVEVAPPGRSEAELDLDALTEPRSGLTFLPFNVALPLKDAREEALNVLERSYVQHALRKENGNVTRAAERSGVSRRFLQRMIARLGIRGALADAEPSVKREAG